MKDTGKKITKLCYGLPVAVVAIARTLKDEKEKVWDRTLRSLKSIDHDVDGRSKVFKRLKLSYDQLNSAAKELFLLCSVFPEDYQIPVEDLTTYGIGLCLCGKVNSCNGARNVVHRATKKLIDSCLIQSDDEERFVKMHDLVREAAHWMAKEEIRFMEGRSLIELQEDAIDEGTLKYLFCHNITDDLPDQLEFFKLEILILTWQNKQESVKIPDAFFKRMAALKMCALDGFSKYRTIILPQSIESLNSLISLSLRGWRLVDIFALEKLQSLRCLELKNCSINELSNGIGKLKKLKLLRLILCDIQKNPFEVIGKMSQLEELYFISNRSSFLPVDNEAIAISSSLQRYHIDLVKRHELQDSINDSISKALSVVHFDAFTTNDKMKNLTRGAEVLHLHELQGDCKTIIPHFVEAVGEVNELIELKLESCSGIEFLTDATIASSMQEKKTFSSIVKLSLKAMDQLKEICHGLTPSDLFENLQKLVIQECSQLNFKLFPGNLNLSNLKVLYVNNCPKLTFLFTLSTAKSLDLLEELEIWKCGALDYIIADESNEGTGKSIVENDHDHGRNSSLFPRLRRLEIDGCEQLEQICSVSSNKRWLPDSTQSSEIQAVDSQQSWSFDTSHCLLCRSINLCHIKEMNLTDCQKLISLFDITFVPTMLLEELRVERCHGLKHIITCEVNDDSQVSYPQILPKLNSLVVQNCKQLEYVIGGYHYEKHSPYPEWSAQEVFPTLKLFYLKQLPNITSISQNNDHPSWSALQKFYLIECPQFTMAAISDFVVFPCGRKLDQSASEGSGVNTKQVHTLGELVVINSNIKGIICLEGNPILGQEQIFGIKSLLLHNLPNLGYTFSGPKHHVSLQNLKTLGLEGCGNLTFIFSTTVLRSLPQLKRLSIINCEALEQIIGEDDQNQNPSNPYNFQEVCFPKLELVYVKSCRKLKYLFGIYTAYKFPELKELIIIDASEIREISRSNGKGETEKQVENALPKLERLLFAELPCFTNLCQWSELRNVKYRVVLNCSKLSLTSTITLKVFIRHFVSESRPKLFRYLFQGSKMVPSDLFRVYNSKLNGLRCLATYEQKHKKTEKGFDGEVHNTEIPPATSSSTDLEVTKMPSTSTSAAHLSEATLLGQPQPVEETKNNKRSVDKGLNEPIPVKALEENKGTNETPRRLDENSDLSRKTFPQSNTEIQEHIVQEPKNPSPAPLQKEPAEKLMGKQSSNEADQKALEEIPGSHINSDDPQNVKPADYYLAEVTISLKKMSHLSFNDLQSVEGRVQESPSKVTFATHSEPGCSTLKQQFEKSPENIGRIAQKDSSTDSEQKTLDNSQKEFDGKKSTGASISMEQGALHEQQINHECPRIVAKPSDSDLVQTVEEHASASTCITISNRTAMTRSLTIPELRDALLTPTVTTTEKTSPPDLFQKGSNEPVSRHALEESRSAIEICQRLEKSSDLAQSTLQGHMRVSKAETYLDKDANASSPNLQDLMDGVFSVLDSMEKDSEVQKPTPSASEIPSDCLNLEDYLILAKAFADLEAYLKMPLKDIANSEVSSHCLENALRFLSNWSSGNGAPLDGLKAKIDSVLQNMPSILSSFKKSSATIDKFTVLDKRQKFMKEELPRRKEAASTLEKYIAEAQQKEAALRGKLYRLHAELRSTENEIEEHKVHLSSLIEQGKKLNADTMDFFKEFETIKKDRSAMLEDPRKAQQEQFKASYEWLDLCNQLMESCNAARNLF